MTHVHPVGKLIATADEAINREDFDAVMGFYAESAMLVVRPGLYAVGKAEIRRAFERIALHFEHTLRVQQRGIKVLEVEGTALVLAITRISAEGMDPIDRKATYVFERGGDGRWLCTIDNSYGHALLEGAPD